MEISHSWKSLRQKFGTVIRQHQESSTGPCFDRNKLRVIVDNHLYIKGSSTGKFHVPFHTSIQPPVVFRLVCYVDTQKLRQQVEEG